MIEKLQGIKQRFDFLSEKLASPDAMETVTSGATW